MSDDLELIFIPRRYESDSQALQRVVGAGPIRDVSGFLQVLELKVELPRSGDFYTQIILNPWAHLSRPPVVHIIGVDMSFFVQQRMIEDPPELLNEAEGRYRISIKPDWDWSEDPNLVRLWDQCIYPVISDSELHRGLKFRSHPKSTAAYNLVFPSGVVSLANTLETFSINKGWKLITKAEEEIMEKKNLAEKEKIRISKQTIFEEYRLEIEWADDEVALNKILAKVESNDDITEELRLQLIDRIQSRLSEFELDRIDFDKLAKITDSNNVNTSNFNPIRRLGGRGK